MNQEMNNFIIKILKNVSPIEENSFDDWLKSIHNKYMTNVRLDPILSERLLWIWLSQVGQKKIQNLEEIRI